MRGKVIFVAGIAVGYVLGARAGRKRYEQIASAASGVWNAPTVQKGVAVAKDFALERVGDVSDTVLDGVKKLINTATKPAPKPAPVQKAAAALSTDTATPKPAAKPAAKSATAKAKSGGTAADAATDPE